MFCAGFTASIDRHGSPEITDASQAEAPAWEAFGMVVLEKKFTMPNGRFRRYTAENWAWLLAGIESPFHRAWLDFNWIKVQTIRDGFTFFTGLHVERDVDRPGRFAATLELQRRYLYDEAAAGVFIDFMAEITAALPPTIGYTTESPTDDHKNTAQFGGPDLDPYRSDQTVLKAFHWLTHATAQVVEALGGTDTIREAGRVHAVKPLPDGAALLVATPTTREYTERVEADLGRYLKPVLPPTEYWWDIRNSNPYRSRR